ncbi:MAG: cytosine/adenosine deaminase-related metal-dependent hydrolase [Myxococcota bacterium]|jgi:cytosine/adenosine deaminase-related metal-dependent hydrolase
MRLVIRNARFLPGIEAPETGGLIVEDGRLAAWGTDIGRAEPDAINAGGGLVLPGLVNGHTHLYSALACGMPAPQKTPENFVQILEEVWWKLDRALDAESLRLSALVGGLEALRSGVTTVYDHHASPNYIDGSLTTLRDALTHVGVRHKLCYEVTDRGGDQRRDAGIAESAQHGDYMGGHAAFTLSDQTLALMSQASEQPLHVHVAEDLADCADGDPLRRFLDSPGTRAGSIIAHGVHASPLALVEAADRNLWLAHCPRSNMNNQVGHAAGAMDYERIVLGTDGIGSDMLTELKTAFFMAQHQHASNPWALPGRLLGNMRALNGSAGWAIGEPADLVLTDYVPPTPLHAGNLAGHLVFGLDRSYVQRVWVGGEPVWPSPLDTAAIYAEARDATNQLWKRMGELNG